MAETVQGLRVRVEITGRVVGDDGALLTINEVYDKTFSDGTGEDQIGWAWQDKSRALNAADEDLDLGTGGMSDFQGADIVANNLKIVYLRNLTATTGDLLRLEEGGTNPATTILNGTGPQVDIGPNGLLLLINPLDGYAITDGSADTIGVEAVDNQTYRAILAGDK